MPSLYDGGVGLQDMTMIVQGAGHSWEMITATNAATPGDAPLLAGFMNFVSVPTAGHSVVLPRADGGHMLFISNHGANDLNVFCAPGDGTAPVPQATLPAGRISLVISQPGLWTGVLGAMV